MLPIGILVLGWAAVAYIIYSVATSILTKRRHAAKALSLKCQDPPLQKNSLPFGIDALLRALDADKNKQFPADVVKRSKENNAITYKYSILGVEQFVTHDEKNIQAILATQFEDFDLGPLRRGNFFPLLGNGIFTEDGKQWEHSRAMMRPQFARGKLLSRADALGYSSPTNYSSPTKVLNANVTSRPGE